MSAIPLLVFILIHKVPFLSGMFSTSLDTLFSSISVAVLLGALWTLHHSYSHDDLTFLLETKMCAHAAREWKLTDCTELGRSSCSSLLTGAGTGCISLSAEQSQSLLVSALSLMLLLPVCSFLHSYDKYAKQESCFFLCLVSVVGKVWSKCRPIVTTFL